MKYFFAVLNHPLRLLDDDTEFILEHGSWIDKRDSGVPMWKTLVVEADTLDDAKVKAKELGW